MQTQTSVQRDQLIGIMRVAMVLSWVAVMAALADGVPTSSGSDYEAPVQPSAAQAAAARGAETDAAGSSSDSETRPTCAKETLSAATREIEETGASNGSVGCGIPGNVAGVASPSTRSEERIDVAALLAWHMQAHNLVGYVHQTTLSRTAWIGARPHGH